MSFDDTVDCIRKGIRMVDRDYSKSGFDRCDYNSGGIPWTTFQRPPNESKNGYFLCRNCGFEIIHISKIDLDLRINFIDFFWWDREGCIAALDQENTILIKVDPFKTDMKCQKCYKKVGFTRELEGDNVSTQFLFEKEKLVYENDSMSCKNCRYVVDNGDTTTTSTNKGERLSHAVLLKPIKNENGKFYDVKTVWESFRERGCKKDDTTNGMNSNMMDICCIQCNAPIGLKDSSTEENEEPFVGYILQNLNHDDATWRVTEPSANIQLKNEFEGKIDKDPSEAKPSVLNDMPKEKSSATGYAKPDLCSLSKQRTNEPNESPTLRGKIDKDPSEAKPSVLNDTMPKEKSSATGYAKPDVCSLSTQRTNKPNESPPFFLRGFVDKYKLKTDERAMSMVSNICDEIENSCFLSECFGENVTERRKTQLKDFNIQFENIPYTQLLNNLCEHFGRKSVLITVFCSAICSWILTCCSGVVDARASYRIGKENDICFVVVTKKKCQKPNVSDRPIFHRSIDDDEMSKEASYIIKKELEITGKQRMDLRMILDKHTSSLLKRHTNITLISISSIKSKNFQTNGKHEMEHKPCIVFYVHVKGFIPIDEDELPSSIDGYPTDIREGNFTPYVRESHKVHDHVKMGCLIQGLQNNKDKEGNVFTGTLGGFIDHPFYGLCCFTSAHAMLSDKDMLEFGRGKTLQPPTDVSCYQPCFPIRFGSLVAAVVTEGDGSCPGVEVAIIKVENRQIDDQGRFPGTDEITFRSGEILESNEILQRINNADKRVIKYGAETALTTGSIHSDISTIPVHHGTLTFHLHNQIEVKEVIGENKFAENGDSGSLVFHCSQDGSLKVIGIVEGGTTHKTYFVTPICAILENLGMPRPYQMKVFGSVPGEHIERRINQIGNSTENLKSDVAELKKELTQHGEKLDSILSVLTGSQPSQTNSVSQ